MAPGCAHLGQSERRGMDGFNGNRYMMQFLLQIIISGQAINKNITKVCNVAFYSCPKPLLFHKIYKYRKDVRDMNVENPRY